MTQNYRIKQLEERVDFLQSLILQQASQGPRASVKLANQATKEGVWYVFVKNLPDGLTWREVQDEVFSLYKKSITRVTKIQETEWALRFKSREDAQNCANKYKNAKVNDHVIKCFVKLVQDEKELKVGSGLSTTFKKRRRIFKNNRNKEKSGSSETVKKY
ncbi:Hypothetical protein DHA2_152280 [Giardia duodenalis]|uniref:RRM domain-containing protein n=1 Tax=Giardia intestinalis TaxID=5741 RepID=V6TBP5_GIAIN|nr:Hypothetical protein DHA2_152280 [Giardia intestinalis]